MAFKYLIVTTTDITAASKTSSKLGTIDSGNWISSSTQTVVPYTGTKPTDLSGYTEKNLATVKSDVLDDSAWGTDRIWSVVTYGSTTTVKFLLSGGSNALNSYFYISDADDYDSGRTYKLYNAKIINETTGGESNLGTITLVHSVAIGTLRLLSYPAQNVTSNCGCGAAHNNNGGTNSYRLEGILSDGYNDENLFVSSSIALTNVTK